MIEPQLQLSLYRKMLLIRRFEETVNELFMQGRIPSTLHLYIGQEAVATGVCADLRAHDYVLSTHRPHGHALAKGVSPRAIMAELFGKATGCCKGKGGSMHVGDIARGHGPGHRHRRRQCADRRRAWRWRPRCGRRRVGSPSPSSATARPTRALFHEAHEHGGHLGPAGASSSARTTCTPPPRRSALAFKIENIADRAGAYGMPGVIVRRQRRAGCVRGGRQSRRAGPRRRRPDAARVQDLSAVRPLALRPADLPLQGEEADWQTREPDRRLARQLRRRGLPATEQRCDADRRGGRGGDR